MKKNVNFSDKLDDNGYNDDDDEMSEDQRNEIKHDKLMK